MKANYLPGRDGKVFNAITLENEIGQTGGKLPDGGVQLRILINSKIYNQLHVGGKKKN